MTEKECPCGCDHIFDVCGCHQPVCTARFCVKCEAIEGDAS